MEAPLILQLRQQVGSTGLYRQALEGRLPVGEILAELGAALGYKPVQEQPPSPPPQSLPSPPLLDNANSVSGPLAPRAGMLSAVAGSAGLGLEALGSQTMPASAGTLVAGAPQLLPQRPLPPQPAAEAAAGQKRTFEELLASPAAAAAEAAAAAAPPSPQLIRSPQAQQAGARVAVRRPPLAPGLARAGSLPLGRAGRAPMPWLRRSASAAAQPAPAGPAGLLALSRSVSAAGSALAPSPFDQHRQRRAGEAPISLPLRVRQMHRLAAVQAEWLAAERPLAGGLHAGAAAFVCLRPRSSSSLVWRRTHLACAPDAPVVDAARVLAEGLSRQHPQQHPSWMSVRLWLRGRAAAAAGPDSSQEKPKSACEGTRELSGPETVRWVLTGLETAGPGRG